MNSIFVKENDYAVVTAFYAISIPEFHMNPHAHDSCEIMYVTDGTCRVWCQEEEILLAKKQFVFIDAGISHKLLITPGQACSVLNIEFACNPGQHGINLKVLKEKSLEFNQFCRKKMDFATAGEMRNLGYALKDLISCLQENGNVNVEDYLFEILFQRMLLELAHCVMQKKTAAGTCYMKKACSYIEENLYGTLKVPEIAAYTGINKSYLQSLFSRFLGCGIIDYINRKRMEQAVFFLINSTDSITDIAFSIGFNSRQHFAHTFEKYYKISPLQYRKLYKRPLCPDTRDAQYILHSDHEIKKVYLNKASTQGCFTNNNKKE